MKPGAHSGGLLAVAILAVLLGTLAVALRLYTRKVVLNQVGIDDYFAIISWVSLYRFDQLHSTCHSLFLFFLFLGL